MRKPILIGLGCGCLTLSAVGALALALVLAPVVGALVMRSSASFDAEREAVLRAAEDLADEPPDEIDDVLEPIDEDAEAEEDEEVPVALEEDEPEAGPSPAPTRSSSSGSRSTTSSSSGSRSSTSATSGSTSGSRSEPEPAPTPRSSGGPPTPTTGTFRVEGQAREVAIQAGSKTYTPGDEVPPGMYDILAKWKAGQEEWEVAGAVGIRPGATTTISCKKRTATCESSD